MAMHTTQAASTGNLTLSGEQTVDGIALVSTNKCLVKNQTTSSENGVYTVLAVSWTKDSLAEGDLVSVQGGDIAVDTLWIAKTTTSFSQTGFSGKVQSNFNFENSAIRYVRPSGATAGVAGGNMGLWGGDGGTGNTAGGYVELVGGIASGTGTGGAVNITGGNSGSGTGGAINIQSGATSGTNGAINIGTVDSGNINLGDATNTVTVNSNLVCNANTTIGSSADDELTINAVYNGDLTFKAGSNHVIKTAAASGAGDSMSVLGNAAGGSGAGGELVMQGGSGSTSGAGGHVTIRGGTGGASDGNGGDVRIQAGEKDAFGGGGGTRGTIRIGNGQTSAIVIGNGTDNTTTTYEGSGQVLYQGNVDCTLGLDVSGGDTTMKTHANYFGLSAMRLITGAADVTTDADPTNDAYTKVAESFVFGTNESYWVEVRVCYRSHNTAGNHGAKSMMAHCYREGGNVVVGTVVNGINQAVGTAPYAIDLVADTTAQTVYVGIKGITSESTSWTATMMIQGVKASS